MKKAILTTILFSAVAVQGCTTHHNHYYPKPESMGIALPAKGDAGALGNPGMMGAASAQVQRRQELESQRLHQAQQAGDLSGTKGPVGNSPRMGQSGMTGYVPSNQSSEPEPFGPAFLEKAVLKVLQWCIELRCGS